MYNKLHKEFNLFKWNNPNYKSDLDIQEYPLIIVERIESRDKNLNNIDSIFLNYNISSFKIIEGNYHCVNNDNKILFRLFEDEVQGNEDDLEDLDKKLPWPVPFPDNEEYQKAEDKRAKKILDAIDNNRFLIRVKFVRNDYYNDGRHNYAFKIIDKYQPIRESKWARIDKKFLVRIIQGEKLSEYIELNANAIVYRLYQIQEPDKDVTELEKILKRLIKLLDITQGNIFNNRDDSSQ
ncbi:1376_t:CDS:2 [Funneliformis geosporum]|uniref:1376_t:CDS:1 n=1 Tax=Funneliformis geosporum TaxID=1117311 RepID=A0A9W4X144_9GLOM|nr:1376_t:CDS:2 [Funneliformis geosporum]